VTLLEGPAIALGAAAALLLPMAPPRHRAAGVVAVLAAAALGAHDDLAGDDGSRGLRGHFAALRHGQVTTGAVKAVGLGVVGVVSTALAGGARTSVGRRPAGLSWAVSLADVAVGGAVVAASANLVNLLDLRPGRALKAVLLCAPLAGGPLGAVAGGAALACIADDLAERSMLGDTGANAVGALLGLAAVTRSTRAVRCLTLTVLVGLTLASEKVSFTHVIATTPWLRRIDDLGRRPAPLPHEHPLS
jgi:UDP-N-acetylmuramyl pentapeptide phosphotransferase/UDP-N-acetylglucosamine-1-phosphate transferase